MALAGCLRDLPNAVFSMGTDTGNSAYLGTEELFKTFEANYLDC